MFYLRVLCYGSWFRIAVVGDGSLGRPFGLCIRGSMNVSPRVKKKMVGSEDRGRRRVTGFRCGGGSM